MRLDLAERLRCPAAHEPTPLVVVAVRVDDRELIDGFAGCPACQLEARVADGAVRFGPPHDIVVAHDAARASATDDDAVARTAALLGLADPGGAVLLSGRYDALSRALRERYEVDTVVIGSRGAVPFIDHTFRAAAIDPASPANDPVAYAVIADAARALIVGGRLLLPAAHALPPAVRRLAEDARERLGEREAPSPIITLNRAPAPRTTSR